MPDLITISQESIKIATQPLGLAKSIRQLKELYEWASSSPRFEENDLYALNAAIEGLKLLQG